MRVLRIHGLARVGSPLWIPRTLRGSWGLACQRGSQDIDEGGGERHRDRVFLADTSPGCRMPTVWQSRCLSHSSGMTLVSASGRRAGRLPEAQIRGNRLMTHSGR